MTGDKRWKVLLVDDEPNNLKLLGQILQPTYDLAFASGGAKALSIAAKVKPDLVLLDIMMPEVDGYETCRRLKAAPQTAAIPVIFVTAMDEVEDERRGFGVGGVDYITKPVSAPLVLARVATHLHLYDEQRACNMLVAKRTAELESSQRAAIYMLGEAGHFNDDNTGAHIWRMADYAETVARSVGWHVDRAVMLKLAAPMHDTGKIGIPDTILKKPAKLSESEWKVMKGHTTIGHSILSRSDTPLFHFAADIALYHHEKWDGSGYPMGLSGEAIPESARIVALADVFDALTMRRPYKEAWTVADALSDIKQRRGNQFDPKIVDGFLAVEEEICHVKQVWDEKEDTQIPDDIWGNAV
ncbi:HD domain-containing phosphohydrolase [Desulfoluna sp.]|uniref:response regulator n=1 Tax=Desulfoluna sp. TaxID=2045199 RepID=UPI00262C8B46|nr:HD domain-containing phosphohydrolase [Desulfoluna sp.]